LHLLRYERPGQSRAASFASRTNIPSINHRR